MSNPNYKVISGSCYYFENTKRNYDDAQLNCQNKFDKLGGKLFEPLSVEINDKVLIASREVVSGNAWFDIGVKRSATLGSDFKFVSSGVTVPYAIPWTSSAPSTSDSTQQCVYARSSDLIWSDNHCNLDWYSICESVLTGKEGMLDPNSLHINCALRHLY